MWECTATCAPIRVKHQSHGILRKLKKIPSWGSNGGGGTDEADLLSRDAERNAETTKNLMGMQHVQNIRSPVKTPACGTLVFFKKNANNASVSLSAD